MSFVAPKPRFLTKPSMERAMEEQLRAANLYPSLKQPAVDIEAFLETHLRVRLDQHADLPSDVLGVSHFCADTVPLVEINRDLTISADEQDVAWAKGRWRSTLAHEASHVVFHRKEYEAATQQDSLFDDPTAGGGEPRLHRCLKRDLNRTVKVDPREYQANFGMAALLMPRELFIEIATPLFTSVTGSNLESFSSSREFRSIVQELSSKFQVSKEAASIRLDTLGLHALIGQSALI